MTLAHRLFSFKGRLRRRDWWLFSLGLYALETVLMKSIELMVYGPALTLTQGKFFTWLLSEPAPSGLFAIHSAIMIALTWPNLALTAKRAHDRDTKGYWLIGVMVAFYASFFVPGDLFEQSGRALDGGDLVGGLPMMAGLIFGLAALTAIIVLGFIDGTRGPNRFGPSPKGIGGDTAQATAEVFE